LGNGWSSSTFIHYSYFEVVHSLHFLDKCAQFIAPTKCTVLNTCQNVYKLCLLYVIDNSTGASTDCRTM